MKIILSNYRFFPSGGPEKYLFSVKREFEKNGIEVFPFSVKYPMNIPSQWDRYFVSPLGDGNSDYYKNYKKNLRTFIKLLDRNVYSYEVYKKSKEYAIATKADLVYSLHFMNKMSPSLIDGFKAAGLPIIVRLSDFNLICPQQNMFINGKICDECIRKGLFSCIRKRCVHNSYFGSAIKALTLKLHYIKKTFNKIDFFICPSRFLLEKYIEAGFDQKKLVHIPTFVDIPDRKYIRTTSNNKQTGKYILYIGRVTEEKGVEVLLKAWKILSEPKYKLVIAGNTNESEYSRYLETNYRNIADFYDFMPFEKLRKIIQNCFLVVVPSICYDNMPNAIIEAYSFEKPVIASNIGSIPEIVLDGITGKLFKPGDHFELSNALKDAIRYKDHYIQMGKQARIECERMFSSQLHLDKLLSLFKPIVKLNNPGEI